jgi:AI-2 transport protein TqsA
MALETERDSALRTPLIILAGAAVLIGLIYGSGFLIPLVIAFMVVNVLEALIERLEGIGLPTAAAVPISILLVLLVLAGFVFVIVNQIDEFVAAWPRYMARLRDLVSSLMAGLGEDFAQRLQNRTAELDVAARLSNALGSATTVLLNSGLVLLYVGFLLAERGRAFARLVSIGASPQRRADLENALGAVSNGIRQYLFVKTIVSLATGGISYFVLSYLGVDFAETWAVVIFLLNYIPSIGSVLGVVFPAVLALVQFETLTPFLIIVGVLAVVQFSIGNIIEPMLMGRSLNLSPFVIMVALTFWSSIWGIAGAFLSVPITVAVVILCREMKDWAWVAVLLSNGAGNHRKLPASTAAGD